MTAGGLSCALQLALKFVLLGQGCDQNWDHLVKAI